MLEGLLRFYWPWPARFAVSRHCGLIAIMSSVPRAASICEFETLRTEIEERLTALIDSQHQGQEAMKLCRTAADREFTKLVMDDLKRQIRFLRAKLKAVES